MLSRIVAQPLLSTGMLRSWHPDRFVIELGPTLSKEAITPCQRLRTITVIS